MHTRLFRRSLIAIGILVVAVASGATVGATVHQSKAPTSALACVSSKGSLVLASGTSCAAGLRAIHIPLTTKKGPRGGRGPRGLAGAQGGTGPQGQTGPPGPDVATTFTGQVNAVSSIFNWGAPEGLSSPATGPTNVETLLPDEVLTPVDLSVELSTPTSSTASMTVEIVSGGVSYESCTVGSSSSACTAGASGMSLPENSPYYLEINSVGAGSWSGNVMFAYQLIRS